MKIGKCFWCGYTKEMTLEHITPKACGGGEEDENKTQSCIDCNKDRGQVPGFHCSIEDFRIYLENWDATNHRRVKRAQKMRKQLVSTLPKMKEVQEKWRKTEELRMGRSPTAEIKLEIPEIPQLAVEISETQPDRTLPDQTEFIKKYFELRRERDAGDESARQKIIDLYIESGAGCGPDILD